MKYKKRVFIYCGCNFFLIVSVRENLKKALKKENPSNVIEVDFLYMVGKILSDGRADFILFSFVDIGVVRTTQSKKKNSITITLLPIVAGNFVKRVCLWKAACSLL